MGFQPAVREAVPVVMSVAGKSGSGKTYSALLAAKGLAKGGRVAVIDTENKRSRIYADDPDVGGFDVLDLYPPFHPDAYIAAIEQAEAAGFDVLVIDSMSHEWSGLGGCIEWADGMPGKDGPTKWIKPKLAHRRMVNRILAAQLHVILCFRANHKLVAYIDERGKQAFAEGADLTPETEKNFVYEMTLSAVVDEDHRARFVKLPKPLIGRIADGQMINAETGAALRDWIDGGQEVDAELERALSIARDVATLGVDALSQHMATMKEKEPQTRERLMPWKRELQAAAKLADQMRAADEPSDDQPTTL